MADLLDLTPLFPDETEAAITQRWADWANEGVSPGDARWVDTREGSMFRTLSMPMTRECARVYDFMGTDVVAAVTPLRSWGTYLEDLGAAQEIYRLAATAAEGSVTFTNTGSSIIVVPAGSRVAAVAVREDDPAPVFETISEITLSAGGGELATAVRAVLPGATGNVSAESVTDVLSPLPGVTAVNESPMTGGTDIESDDALRQRIIDSYRGKGGGNIADYKRWVLARPGVGRVTVIPVWDGPGTVKVILTTAAGQPVAASVVTDVQNFLDPVPGQSKGYAPVGDNVVVETPALLAITVTANVEPEQGYSISGSGGSVALDAAIKRAVNSYITSVESGGEIVIAQVAARIAETVGVHDVSAVKLNGATVNIAISSNPAKVPAVSSQVYTEAVI